MAVNFKQKIAGKKTKLAGKSLERQELSGESPVIESYLEGNLYKIPLTSIAPDPNQPRKSFDETKLGELAGSIKSNGVLQPIILRRNDREDIDFEFLVVAGERRFRASKLAELRHIPALFSKGDPEEIALIENLQRDDLKPVEEAEAYRRIMESHNYSQVQLSAVVGKARTTINEILRLTTLPEAIKAQCRTSDTPKNVLIEIAKRDDPEEMALLFEKVKNEKLTVAKIRQLTRVRPTREVRELDVRFLEKVVESKRLLHKLKANDLNNEMKVMLKHEVKTLYEMTKKLIEDEL